jgi:hypothetical protein
MKHFPLFLNPQGQSMLPQLWKNSLKGVRAGVRSLPGIGLTPRQYVLQLAGNSLASPQAVLAFYWISSVVLGTTRNHLL